MSGAPPSAPAPTAASANSCLAKLLTSSAHHSAKARKTHLGFDMTWASVKGQKSPSATSLPPGGSVHLAAAAATSQQRLMAAWPVVGGTRPSGAGSPLELGDHRRPPVQGGPVGPQASAPRVGAPPLLLLASPRPPALNASSALLVPKTEVLSPVQVYSPELIHLTGSASGHAGQDSPSAALEQTTSRPESRLFFTPHGKIEAKVLMSYYCNCGEYLTL
ncbi:hypothetical protein CRUP_017468 [Coryphaenoides rupestris]|nr:hypothetical protein CRUP_017468 [Coryphaenoides rupestris]